MDPLSKLEWRNLNAGRNYPFMDGASLFVDNVFIPQSWILDARIYARGNYAQKSTCYVSKMVRSAEVVALQIKTGGGLLLGEAKVFFVDSTTDLIPIYDGTVVAGCLVIDPARNSLLQAFAEGEYEFTADIAPFLPSVCEYLPADQVQSINNFAGDVTITGNDGIQVIRRDANTIQINIVGDPHFNRYNCVTGDDQASTNALDLNGIFLKNVHVVHYLKNSLNQLVGPVVSKLKKKNDGSIALVLKSAAFEAAVDTRDLRPAFRITADKNTLTFSMAGAS
jgi:hypothetical protein